MRKPDEMLCQSAGAGAPAGRCRGACALHRAAERTQPEPRQIGNAGDAQDAATPRASAEAPRQTRTPSGGRNTISRCCSQAP